MLKSCKCVLKAQQEGHYRKTLQWLLTHSFYAKALAVKRVTNNRGKNTAGVDHELWLTPEAKFKAINKLKRRGSRPQPLKRVYIPKKNGKLRPLSIPTMTDRAMQTLYMFALAAVTRTPMDSNRQKYARCNRAVLYRPEQRRMAKVTSRDAWPRMAHGKHSDGHTGFTEMAKVWICRETAVPHRRGYAAGPRTISPTLMNMTLDGLERLLKERLPTNSTSMGKLTLIR